MKSDKIQKEAIAKLFNGKAVNYAKIPESNGIILQVTDSFFAVFHQDRLFPASKLFLDPAFLTEIDISISPEELDPLSGPALYANEYLKIIKGKELLRQFIRKDFRREIVFSAWINTKIFSYFKVENLRLLQSSVTPGRILIFENKRLYGFIQLKEKEWEGNWQ